MTWTHIEGIGIAIAIVIVVGWTALSAWIGWSWGFVKGHRNGWEESRKLCSKYGDRGVQL